MAGSPDMMREESRLNGRHLLVLSYAWVNQG
jgi:hypothetical protein